MVSSSAADAKRTALLRHVAGEAPSDLPTEESWEHWMDFAWRERLVPVLFHLVVDQEQNFTEVQQNDVYDALVEAMAVAAQIDQQLVNLAEVLETLDVPYVALKGAATANIDYPDPSWRQYGDLDLLVASEHFDQVRGALTSSGWRQGYPIPHGHEKFTHAVTFTRGRGWEVDLHQRIAHRGVGLRIPVTELLHRRVSFEIAGAQLWALSASDRLIHAAVHAELSRLQSRRLSSVADVLLLATAHRQLAEELVERADSWRVRQIVQRSIEHAYGLAEIALPQEWETAFDRPPRKRDRLLDLAYAPGRRRPALEELAHLRLMPTWRDRSLYVRSYLIAGDEYARQTNRHGPVAQGRYLISRLRDR